MRASIKHTPAFIISLVFSHLFPTPAPTISSHRRQSPPTSSHRRPRIAPPPTSPTSHAHKFPTPSDITPTSLKSTPTTKFRPPTPSSDNAALANTGLCPKKRWSTPCDLRSPPLLRVEQFQQALQISPENVAAHYGLGCGLLELSKECISSGAFRWGCSILKEAPKVVKTGTFLAKNVSCMWNLHGDIQVTHCSVRGLDQIMLLE